MPFAFGFVSGLSVALLALLLTLARYVQSDLDSFQRWLDKGAAA